MHHRPKQRKKRDENKSNPKTIAVLTSGGDAPGMNAALRSVVRYGIGNRCQVFGIIRGYRGLLATNLSENTCQLLSLSSVANIIQRGGTILRTDRCEEFFYSKYRKLAAAFLRQRGMDGLIVIGGDGSFTGAHLLENETGFPTLGIPATIDNDIYGSEDSIGFDTAVNTAIDAIDRIRDTASSHERIFLVEVMGRSSGHIALKVGMGGGAETIIVPEVKESIQSICQTIQRGVARGKTGSIIVVAEGPKPGLSNRISTALARHGFVSRVCILGHIQRGGAPTAHDRTLASVLGAQAVKNLLLGRSNAMVGMQDNKVICSDFSKNLGRRKRLSHDEYALTKILAT